jgi:DNA-3-methyladenine glycosylase II
MRRIDRIEDIDEGLEALCRSDPRLAAIRDRAGIVPLRRSPPGFASLASVIVSQQVSRASADAIFGRLTRLVDPLTPEAVTGLDDAVFREAGFSRPKQKALVSAARAVRDGLDLAALEALPAEEAIARLVAVSGIGPWTAEVYLLFAVGHADVFPSRDLALQVAVGQALGMEARPDARTVAALAESWSPWRGVAARLLWAFYREIRGREAVPAPTPSAGA